MLKQPYSYHSFLHDNSRMMKNSNDCLYAKDKTRNDMKLGHKRMLHSTVAG